MNSVIFYLIKFGEQISSSLEYELCVLFPAHDHYQAYKNKNISKHCAGHLVIINDFSVLIIAMYD